MKMEKQFVYVWISEYRNIEEKDFEVNVLGVFSDLKQAQDTLKQEVKVATQEDWNVQIESTNAVIMTLGNSTQTYTIIRKELE